MSTSEKVNLGHPILRAQFEKWPASDIRALDEARFFHRVNLNWISQPRFWGALEDKKSKNYLARWVKTG